LKERVLPWVGEQLERGRALAGDIGEYEAAITTEQRGYFHRVVLGEIAAHAPGPKYPMEVWKEWFREKFLGFKDVTAINPITGKKTKRRMRMSTEDLGVRGYAKHIEQVIAFASTELGLTISEPLPAHLRGTRAKPKREIVDQETGEITELTA
jgi:hypothetical protein